MSSLNQLNAFDDMTPEERAKMNSLLAEFYQRDERTAAQQAANNERLQRAIDTAHERFPGKAAQNFDAFMNEVLRLYNELD